MRYTMNITEQDLYIAYCTVHGHGPNVYDDFNELWNILITIKENE